jgi:hypothetical protein
LESCGVGAAPERVFKVVGKSGRGYYTPAFMEGYSQKRLVGLALRLQPWLILLAGVLYWGAYLRFWFNPHDEGGTVALTAQRILAGELPIKDVALGYNILWFYPVVWLFQVTGVHYVKMRAFFFALSAVTALAGWAVVKRVTGRPWLAFFTALMLVVFPGSQFKNYIPLMGMLNTLCLVRTCGREQVHGGVFFRDCFFGGLVLGVCYLVRIDLGFLFSALWLGVMGLGLADARLGFGRRVSRFVGGSLLLISAVVLCHVPAELHARSRGYAPEFRGQYAAWGGYLLKSASTLSAFQAQAPAVKVVVPNGAPDAGSQGSGNVQNAGNAEGQEKNKARLGWAQLRSEWGWKAVALFSLTYLPLAGFVAFFGMSLGGSLAALRRREWTLAHPAAMLGWVAFGSLATFPQFFFFRPDRPHLSEFMVGHLVLIACGVALAFSWAPKGKGNPWLVWGMAVVSGIHVSIYGWYALDHPSAGTIAARYGRKLWFRGENGVEVKVSKAEAKHLEAVRDAIHLASRPGEFVVCYPYQPGYNLMAGRPTYERSLYVDNVTRSSDWPAETVRALQSRHPAAVVIDDRPINGYEASRFSRWADSTYRFLKDHYQLVAASKTTEVYAPRPEPTAP